jgi:hypothetical protein
MRQMHERSVPSVAAVAIVVGAACLALVSGCVPRPAGIGSPPATGTGSSTVSIEPDLSLPVGPVGPTPSPSFVRPTALPAPTFLAYTVKSHDTLTSIAREFHTTPRSIAFWSRAEHPSLDPESATYQPDRLEVGWILRLIPDAVFDEDELMDAPPSPAPGASSSAAASPTPGATAG